MPIKQWLYFVALECLPEHKVAFTEDKCLPVRQWEQWKVWEHLEGRLSLTCLYSHKSSDRMVGRWLYLDQTPREARQAEVLPGD